MVDAGELQLGAASPYNAHSEITSNRGPKSPTFKFKPNDWSQAKIASGKHRGGHTGQQWSDAMKNLTAFPNRHTGDQSSNTIPEVVERL